MKDETSTDQSFDVPTIKDLIRSSLDAGKSVRELAEDSGHRVKFQTFQELSVHAPKQFPKNPETITGMALALKVSETAIVLAYASGIGITVTAGSNFAMRLPADVDRLSPDMQDALVALTRAALTTAPAPSKADHVARALTGNNKTRQGGQHQRRLSK
ncbi:hypothetical protein [Mycobacterium gordonae]|uniref:hypothetical protein n=1 Tax=Mycobacterium gordonae TaxID=1778 RepID=UPI0012EA9010|nr:hypothetical protein [Mycobacterium gordonae]